MKTSISPIPIKWRDFHDFSSRARHGPIELFIEQINEGDEHLDGCGYAWKWVAEHEDSDIDDWLITMAYGGEDSMEEAKRAAEKWMNTFVHYIKNPDRFRSSDPASDL